MSLTGNAKSYIHLKGSLNMPDAIHGKSAYEIAVANGFKGSEKEWLASFAVTAKAFHIDIVNDNGTYTVDKTGAEIIEAYNAGSVLIGIAKVNGDKAWHYNTLANVEVMSDANTNITSLQLRFSYIGDSYLPIYSELYMQVQSGTAYGETVDSVNVYSTNQQVMGGGNSGGSDGADGADGADGFSPTVKVSKLGKVTTITITDKDGTKTATINDGEDGTAGAAGKDGKSAYAYAQDGGYTGTEAEFAEKLASEANGNTSAFQTARGSWTTTGTITCGFKPDVVFITDASIGAAGDYTKGAFVWETRHAWFETWEDTEYETLYVTDTGFVVDDPYGANGTFAGVDHTYYYLAVKFG